LQDDYFDQYVVEKGSDIFISVWNLHRSPAVWEEPERFMPDRYERPGDDPMSTPVGLTLISTDLSSGCEGMFFSSSG